MSGGQNPDNWAEIQEAVSPDVELTDNPQHVVDVDDN